jgi:hypothetical protein
MIKLLEEIVANAFLFTGVIFLITAGGLLVHYVPSILVWMLILSGIALFVVTAIVVLVFAANMLDSENDNDYPLT